MNKLMKITGICILGIGFLTGCSDKVAQNIENENKKPIVSEVKTDENLKEETRVDEIKNEENNQEKPNKQSVSDLKNNITTPNINKKTYNHNLKEAGKVIEPMIYSLVNQKGSNITNVLQFYASRDGEDNVVKNISAVDILDLINTYNEKTYNIDDVLQKLRTEKNVNFVELNTGKKDYNNAELGKLVAKVDEKDTIVYFKKDNTFLLNSRGGIGGASDSIFAPENKWKIDGDKVVIPYVTVATNKPTGVMTLRLNNKNYASGKNKTMYYVESFIIY